MGLVFTVLYIGLYYLSPAYVLGPLMAYHVQLILVLLAVGFSIPALLKSFVLKTPQTYALTGLIGAVFISRFIELYYLTGALSALAEFIPSATSYLLICLNCTTKKRLQFIVLMMFSICLIFIVNGYSDLIRDVPNSGPPPGVGVGAPTEAGATASPYLMRQSNGQGGWTYRLQGLGEINDPNDFGQVEVCLLPLMFMLWRPKKVISNLAFVILPSIILIFGIFLTHSRGALVTLLVVLIVAGRRRIGTVPAIALAGCLFIGAMAFQFTGGRQISAGAGEDRTALWGEGLAVFKDHPVFGVGFAELSQYTDSNLTAHNSVVVCAAELGILGLFCWSMFLFPVLRNGKQFASSAMVADAARGSDRNRVPRQQSEEAAPGDKEQITRFGQSAFLAFIGYLVAGLFLSRAFNLTLFLLGGLVESIYQMGLNRAMVAPRLPFQRVVVYSAGLSMGLVAMIYIAVRLLNFAR